MVALHTGMRKGEILALRWPDVDFSRRILTIHKSKTGLKRGIPLSDTLTDVLRDLKKGRKLVDISGRVFPIAERSLQQGYKKALGKAGIKDIRPHDFRRTFASRLRNKGVIPTDIKVLMGQSVPDVLEVHYTHDYVDHLRQCVSKLDEYYEEAGVGVRMGELLR